jgi:glutathione peroxidase-family protein
MGVMHDLFRSGNYVDNPYKSFFDIKARDLNKNLVQMNQYYKNILLVVNISPADKTLKEEYDKLITLKECFKNENFEILAFPSAQLDNIEISDREMKEQLMSIEYVKDNMNSVRLFNRVYLNGEEISEVYKFLLRNSPLFMYREGKSQLLNENSSKFLLSKDGQVYSYYGKDTDVEEIKKNIRYLLAQNVDVKPVRHDLINFNKFY